MKKSPIITVRDLTKRYDDFVAVDDISFEVRQGEIFGMVGPNGRSKWLSASTVSRGRCWKSVSSWGFLCIYWSGRRRLRDRPYHPGTYTVPVSREGGAPRRLRFKFRRCPHRVYPRFQRVPSRQP